MKSLIANGDNMCPVKSMGLSNLRRISELLGVDDKSFHVETITDGDESDSLMRDPGRKATVPLCHIPGSTGSPGGGAQFEVVDVNEDNGSVQSLLYANGVAGSLSNHLLRSNPRGSQLFLSRR